MKEIYCNYKIQILKDGEKYFLRFDGGQVASLIKEIGITDAEVQELMNITSVDESSNFLINLPMDRWIKARLIPPSEYIGNTGMLY